MIRLGIIGGGINSAVGRAHVAALRMTGKFELTAGCFSRNSEQNAASARSYGCLGIPIPAVVMDKKMIDRVVVLSPTPDHFGHVMTALRSNLPVLCEKALGATPEETANLCRASEQMHVPLSCVFNYFFYDAVQRVWQIIKAGELGKITHIRAEMPQAGYLASSPQAWRLTDAGIYLDLMTHLLQLVSELTGEKPVEVTANERTYSSIGVVDYVSAFVSYKTFTTDFFVSKCSAGNTNGLRLRIYGEKKSVDWVQQRHDFLTFGNSAHSEEAATVEVPNKLFKLGHPSAGFVGAMANLYEAWADNSSYSPISPVVAHQGLRAIYAMRESAKTGRHVSL